MRFKPADMVLMIVVGLEYLLVFGSLLWLEKDGKEGGHTSTNRKDSKVWRGLSGCTRSLTGVYRALGFGGKVITFENTN
ncbi:MAG TPA: hypothetical protein VFU31_19600 [Candidatus Binatia bacterium]|nr:hypothetical protein [Candidatus Binatia bacterium]